MMSGFFTNEEPGLVSVVNEEFFAITSTDVEICETV